MGAILGEGTRDDDPDGEIRDDDEESEERGGDDDKVAVARSDAEIAAAFEKGRREGEAIGMMKASAFWRMCFSFEDHSYFYIFLHKQSLLLQDGETLISTNERVSITATPTSVTVTVIERRLEDDFLKVLHIDGPLFRETCEAEGAIGDTKELTETNSTYRHGMMTFRPSHRIGLNDNFFPAGPQGEGAAHQRIAQNGDANEE